jgi:DNA-binding NtrC family response regulator
LDGVFFRLPRMLTAPIRVLVVDDEPLIRWAVTSALTPRGCRVAEAADARSALQLLARPQHLFEVVILDYHLPDSCDLALLGATRRLSPASQIIMTTAFMTPDVVDRARALGACEVMDKPVDLDRLAAIVTEMRHARP